MLIPEIHSTTFMVKHMFHQKAAKSKAPSGPREAFRYPVPKKLKPRLEESRDVVAKLMD